MKLQIKNLCGLLVALALPVYSQQETYKLAHDQTLLNANVSNLLEVGGNDAVAGTLIANSFYLPVGKVIAGIRNYAVLANQLALNSDSNVLWTATPVGSLSSAISLNPLTGQVALPNGLFLVQYSVRILRAPTDGYNAAVAQLQQTVNGIATNITQPAIINNAQTDGISDPTHQSSPQVTGYALVSVNGASNNMVNLVVTFGGEDTIPAATGPDANAQMVIIQLN